VSEATSTAAAQLAPPPGEALARMRAAAPLVHNITNYVVMNATANALIAAGASPAMIHAPEEAAEFAAIAAALVVNIGTLSTPWVTSMTAAARAARAAGRPWILDPVGVGATAFRRASVVALLAERPTVIRGNASEILVTAGAAGGGRGVDSTAEVASAEAAAIDLARGTGAVVVVSGPVDYVTDGTATVRVANGAPLLGKVTGTGCMATALIGAFLGAGVTPLAAAVAGMTLIGVAGEVAAEGAPGPGTFAVRLLDALYALTPERIASAARLS
jgi:hydroxyethylthiazole kinase